MKDTRLLPDDPRLTAYALGEASGDERVLVEAALQRDPALRMRVDEIRTTAAQLEAAFASEGGAPSSPRSAAHAHLVIELNGHAAELADARAAAARAPESRPARARQTYEGDEYRAKRSRHVLLGFPQAYYFTALAAAAGFAVMVALYDPPRPSEVTRPVRTVRQELVLLPPESMSAEAVTSDASVAPAVESVATLPPNPVSPIGAPALVDAKTVSPAPAIKPMFLDRSLSLIDQARWELEAGASGPPLEGSLGGRGTAVIRLEDVVAGGASRAGRTNWNAFTPPVAAPVVAASTLPSVVPPAVAVPAMSGGSVATPGSGDIIVLSTVTVTADRAVGFATGSATPGIASDKRGPPGRDDRPHPPPGARFGRNVEAYSYVRDNDFVSAAQHRVSTLAVDVDSGSYASVRRIIEHGTPPPRDAVRIEEMLNYFPYHYAPPKGEAPFAASLEVAAAPWAPGHRLVRIGLKARDASTPPRPPASLVFLLDVSGSMNQLNKLPLVQQAMRSLLGKLQPDDRVAIVTYGGESGLALPSTPVVNAREIINAVDTLAPVGPADGPTGIQLAYDIAKANFVSDGINRVILCTDGDFNVGMASEGELVRLVEEKGASGVFLTALGFGMGNYKDATLEKLALKGRGSHGYIDTRGEAEKLLAEQVGSPRVTVAKDVKLQVEFNPANVASYRLIGYENRLLRREDFNHDNVDAGEIGAGHALTALYEIVPVETEDKSDSDSPPVDELRYASRGSENARLEPLSARRDLLNNELLTVTVRYKKPDGLFNFPKTLEFQLLNATNVFAKASADLRFAAAVAQFGMILRGSPHRGNATMRDVAAWAAGAASQPGDDPGGYRAEFVELVRKAQAIVE